MSVMTVRCKAVLLAASCLLLPACLDLELPNVPGDGGVGPTLTIHSPTEGQTISLNAPVSVDAVSVNGVSSVTVTCGGAPSTGVFTWNVPPYTGIVDFTRCTLVTSGTADSGVGQLQLTFIGVDQLGNVSTKSLNVLLDTTTASLFAALPARVYPLAPVTLTVGSDRPLLLPPTVRLSGREAEGIVQRANPDGGAPLYDVTFLAAPGLGIDSYTGDPFNVPFEVLSDVEKSIGLTVDARATNGNASHLEQGVLLSRVLWDRAVPGRIALAAAAPPATPQGIQVALATVDPNPTTNPNVEWLPGFFRAADGTYVPFDPSKVAITVQPSSGPIISPVGLVARSTEQAVRAASSPWVAQGVVGIDAGTDAGVTFPFPVDAGFLAVDFDALGRTVFQGPAVQRLSRVTISLEQPVAGTDVRPGTAYLLPGTLTKPLTRVDDLVCLPDLNTSSGAGCAAAPASQAAVCVSAPDGGILFSLGTSNTLALGAADAGSTAGSIGAARTYLAPNDEPSSCGQAWSVFGLANNLAVFQDRADPAFGGGFCRATGVSRLLPVPDGSFVVSASVQCGVTAALPPQFVVLRVGTTGTILGSYVYKQGVAGTTEPTVLAALDDGSIVTLRNDPPNTTFELWALNDSAPAATARVPGLYLYRPNPARLPSSVQAGADGSFSVLLNSASLGDVVLHVGPGLQPKWIYRYPRVVNVAGLSTLISAPALGSVYYVDPTNNDIVALKRF